MSDLSNGVGDDFDLDSIFTDGSSPVGLDAVFECDKPHWRVSREEFKKVLQIVSSFPSRSTVFMAVWRQGSLLCVHANNRDALVDAQLPILNSQHCDSNKVYFLDTNKLLAFVNAYSQFVFSFDSDGSIFYESPYVRYKLDTLKVSLDEVMIKYDEVKNWIKFPLSKSEVGVLKNLYNFAIKLSDSKVLLDKERSEAFYTLYKYMVNRKTNVNEKVVIRRLDLPTIHEVTDDALEFAYTKERLFFKFGFGVISFLRVPYDEASFMYPETFATGKELGKFSLDVPIIKRALKLTSLFSPEEVSFFAEGKDIYMGVSDKAKFKVGSGDSGINFELGLDTFSKLLGTVEDSESTVSVVVTEHGVDLSLSSSALYSLSRVSVSQIKRKDKDAMRLGTLTASSAASGAKLVMPEKVQAGEFQDVDLF